MAQASLNKSIEVRRLNPKNLGPLPGPEVTVPFGATLERIERNREMAMFRYLGELYGCPFEVLASAVDASALEGQAAAAPVQAAEPAKTVLPDRPRILWEHLVSSGPAVMRARVPHGWLVVAGTGLAFYPDAGHQWDGTSLPEPAGE